MPKKVCFFTGTRAEYGLLRPVIRLINSNPEATMQLLVSGSHLSKDFGETWREIEADGFSISDKVEILSSDTSEQGVCHSMGLAISRYGDSLKKLSPDILVILGDRYEALAAAIAATICGIPIAHLHGGELTLGAIDDSFRHAITKMSHLHFTSAEEHRVRVIQMGEGPDFVFNVGALGVESILSMEPYSKVDVEAHLRVEPDKAYILVTYHPVTLESESSLEYLKKLLIALERFPDFFVIFTGANADAQGHEINQYIQDYVSRHGERYRFFMSLGSKLYFSAVRYASLVIGNSSSGIIEIPSLGVPVVNLGNRQLGRMQSHDIVNCGGATAEEVELAIYTALTRKLTKVNPYEKPESAKTISELIMKYNFSGNLRKHFYKDLN